MVGAATGDFSMRPLPLIALAAFLIVPGAALAEPGHHGPCMQDLKSYCAGVQPGEGRIRHCMHEHRAQLSAGCKIAIANRVLERGGSHHAEAKGPHKPVK
jgi:hypothetical protein